jgi:polysaccharide export outer membrane protein
MKRIASILILAAVCPWISGLAAQKPDPPIVILPVGTSLAEPKKPVSNYVLGPGDQVGVQALDLEELEDRKVRIDMRGDINLPLAGRLHVAGLTVDQVESAVAFRLRAYLREPTVTVSIEEFRSQPVSVLGAVGTPGVVQLQGRKTLFEVLSMAGGLKPEAGNLVVITRQKDWGTIPLRDAKLDPTGQFSLAEVSVKSIMAGKNPQENVLIQPNDVISVPRAELVYVIGAVKKPGGYILNERETISVLQALSLAEGLDRAASPKTAKILHSVDGSSQRTETVVDIRKILSGQSSDVALAANDILFLPTSAAKNAAIRGAEAALQIGTGLAIYRR